jgi:HMW1-like protein
MSDRPSLPLLERLVAEKRFADAMQMALRILEAIDNRGGRLDHVVAETRYHGGTEEDLAIVFATRFAAAYGRLVTESNLEFTSTIFERLLMQYRWIDLIFSLSGFRTSDSFLWLIAQDAGKNQLKFAGPNFLRLLAMFTMNSFVDVDFDQFWRVNPVASAVAFFNYISSRYVFSSRAFEFRERLLEWFPARLSDVKFGGMTLARLPEVYMHCSYAITPKKHEIKRPLMQQMRRACLESGVVEAPIPIPKRSSERATVVVVGERYTPGHSIFRTHSRAVQSLRERFRLVGVLDPHPTAPAVVESFDECIGFPKGDFFVAVKSVAAEITMRQPALIFFPSIGMTPHVIALAALRLAPIQCASYGHMATTMSPMMDYMIFPEDFVGAPRCFSEKILALPKTAMPFTPRSAVSVERRPPDGTVRVAIPASTMKLNPLLFDAIARIGGGAKTNLSFEFFPLAATGLPYFELSRILRRRLPRAKAYPEAPYDTYMARLANCDLFLCPFPYGNTNGIVDSFQLGLPGICLDGEEAHAHTDTALFDRIGLPAGLTAQTVDDYVAAAIKMIDDEAWRVHCSAIVRNADLDSAFFRGDPRLFCSAIENLLWPPATSVANKQNAAAPAVPSS